MKKILLYIPDFGSGGAERQFCGLAVQLKKTGYDVKVIYHNDITFYKWILENEGIDMEYHSELSNKLLRSLYLSRLLRQISPDVVKAAKQIHKYIPRIGIINWDFMINEKGEPVLLEANSRNGNGIFLIQSAQGLPVFGDDTEKIMKWISQMDKVGKTRRYRERLHL